MRELKRCPPHPDGRYREACYRLRGMHLHIRTLRLHDGTRQAPDVIASYHGVGAGLAWMSRDEAARKLRRERAHKGNMCASGCGEPAAIIGADGRARCGGCHALECD